MSSVLELLRIHFFFFFVNILCARRPFTHSWMKNSCYDGCSVVKTCCGQINSALLHPSKRIRIFVKTGFKSHSIWTSSSQRSFTTKIDNVVSKRLQGKIKEVSNTLEISTKSGARFRYIALNFLIANIRPHYSAFDRTVRKILQPDLR